MGTYFFTIILSLMIPGSVGISQLLSVFKLTQKRTPSVLELLTINLPTDVL